jgi:hypothetical protein
MNLDARTLLFSLSALYTAKQSGRNQVYCFS